MPTSLFLAPVTKSVVCTAAVLLLAACQQQGQPHASKSVFPQEPGEPVVRADTFAMAQVNKFDQPYPEQPLFGSKNYLRKHDVMPVALADVGGPLPPGVPLPASVANIDVLEPQASTSKPSAEQGGASPAAGMAQGITNAQGDSKSSTLDGSGGK